MKLHRATLRAALLVTALAAGAAAQAPVPTPSNAPSYVKAVKQSGIEVRFLDFKWDQQAFATLMGDGDHPVGRRSWVLARLMLWSPMRCLDKTVPVGSALLVLNPARAGAGAEVELRAVDMRDVFTNLNVVAEPPAGETYCKGPAAFVKVGVTAPRLDVRVADAKDRLEVTTHYGDHELTFKLYR